MVLFLDFDGVPNTHPTPNVETHMKTHKQQLIDAKSARTGITDQKPVSPNSRAKRRRVMLRAFVPAMLGWPAARWDTVGKYLDRETAQLRADTLAKNSWLYRHATSWTIDGEPYTPRTLDVAEPTVLPTPIRPAAPWRVVRVDVEDGHSFTVRFVDGLEGVVRIAPSFMTGVFSVLRDETLFRQARIEHGVVTWPGEIDLASDAMYDEIKVHGVLVLK